MLKQTYLARMKQVQKENPGAEFIVVTRSAGHILSPSKKLLWDYKGGRCNWDCYTRRFLVEMDTAECWAEMKKIWDMAQKKDVYLVCYEPDGQHCHRHILIELMNKMFGHYKEPRTVDPVFAKLKMDGDRYMALKERINEVMREG